MSDFTEDSGPLAPKDLDPWRPHPTDSACAIGAGSMPQPDETPSPSPT